MFPAWLKIIVDAPSGVEVFLRDNKNRLMIER